MAGPLEGIRVLEACSVVLGPWAAQVLGDLGADVIKIEPPEGDVTRGIGPARNPGMAAFYLGCNRSKRSLVLDLKHPSGRGALLRLARNADVFLHNFRPRAARALGLEYEAFQAVNPRIIYCATYGFRAAGPYADRPAYDDIIQASAGLASLQAVVADQPRYIPTIVADKTSSMAVLSGILAALVCRERTGAGQAIEVPMFETVVAWAMVEHLFGETFVPPIGTAGYERILNNYRGPYRTKDGFLSLLPYTDQQWRTFVMIAGRADLQEDPRFATFKSRLGNIQAVAQELTSILATRTTAAWLEALGTSNVPVAVVNSLETLLRDPQLEATNFWKIVEHPTEKTLRFPDTPISFSLTPSAPHRLPPRLGEHSREVLREAGFESQEVDDMLAAGVTACGARASG